MLVGIDASRITRPRRTGTENYSLHVLRGLLTLDPDNAYRLYLSAPLADGLLPLTRLTTTKLIRLPRLWTQLGLSGEMLADPPDVLFGSLALTTGDTPVLFGADPDQLVSFPLAPQ